MLARWSNYKVFWRDGVNYPSLNMVQDILNTFNDQNTINVNFVNNNTIEVISNKDNVEQYSIIQIKSSNYDLYYIYDSFRFVANNKLVLTFKIDNYLTYIYPFLVNNGDKNFYFIRNPVLDASTLAFNDPLVEDIKYTGNYLFNKFYFKNIGLRDVFYWEYQNSRITYPQSSQGDVVNGVMYAVFNAGENGKYYYIPVLSRKNNLYYEINSHLLTTINYRIDFNFHGTGVRYSINDDCTIYDNNNNIISFNIFKEQMTNYLQGDNINIYIGDRNYPWVENKRLAGIDDLLSMYAIIYIYHPTPALDRYRVVYNSDFAKQVTFDIKGYTHYNEIDYINLQVIPSDPSSTPPVWQRYNIGNSYANISALKNSVEFSNKFLGIYFMPHVLFLADKAVIKTLHYTNPVNQQQQDTTFLMFDFEPEGNIIYERPWLNDILEFSVTPTKDNNVINNWYLYKYLKTKYYNNDLDLSYYYDFEKKQFLTQGYFNFTGSGNYIDKIDQKSITDCLISYPYQLPSGTDGYLKYVSANYNSTNTSVSVAKQQMAMSLAGGLFSLASSIPSMIGNPASAFSSLGNFGFGAANSIMSYKNNMRMLKSQYADARNTNGTQINNSMLIDAAWINYYLKDDSQYSGIEMFYGNESFNMSLNNMIYYYSYYSPRYNSLNNIINTNWDNNFIQIDESDLSNKVPLMLKNKYNLDAINIIINALSAGIRLWNVDPEV